MSTSETSALMQEVNDMLRELSAGTDAPVAFFCECGDPHCFRPVWLSLFAFDQARIHGELLLASHQPLQLVA